MRCGVQLVGDSQLSPRSTILERRDSSPTDHSRKPCSSYASHGKKAVGPAARTPVRMAGSGVRPRLASSCSGPCQSTWPQRRVGGSWSSREMVLGLSATSPAAPRCVLHGWRGAASRRRVEEAVGRPQSREHVRRGTSWFHATDCAEYKSARNASGMGSTCMYLFN